MSRTDRKHQRAKSKPHPAPVKPAPVKPAPVKRGSGSAGEAVQGANGGLLKDLFGDRPSGSAQHDPGRFAQRVNGGVAVKVPPYAAPADGGGDHVLDDAWKRIHQRRDDSTVLAISRPPGKLDRLADAALKSAGAGIVKRLRDVLAHIGADIAGMPAIDEKDGGQAAKQHLDVALQRWLTQMGVASRVKAVTARLQGRRDLSDGRRLVLSAGYTLLLADLIVGAGSREGLAKLLRDDAGVADAILFELERKDGLLDRYAEALVKEVMDENRMCAGDNAVQAVVRQVRAGL